MQEAPRLPISAFIICCNEQKHIAECIASVAFCDEIVVIDSFSTDNTVEIAQGMGAKVIQHTWEGYIRQKAFGLTQVTHEWVVNIDADERVSEALQKEIVHILSQESIPYSGYEMNRIVYYLGRWWRKGGWYPEYRLRFFKRSGITWGGVEPHDKPITSGKIGRLNGEILHYTYENMDDQFRRLQNYSTIAAREEYKRGKRVGVISLFGNPLLRILKFYFVKKGYREGIAGLIVAIAEGYYTFMKYAKIWELQAQGKENHGKS